MTNNPIQTQGSEAIDFHDGFCLRINDSTNKFAQARNKAMESTINGNGKTRTIGKISKKGCLSIVFMF